MREVLKVRPGGAYEVLRAHHPQTQLVMDNLAALLRAQGRYDEALKLRVLNSELSVRSRVVSVKKGEREVGGGEKEAKSEGSRALLAKVI